MGRFKLFPTPGTYTGNYTIAAGDDVNNATITEYLFIDTKTASLTATIPVTIDTIPPIVTILSPSYGAIFTVASQTVTGTVTGTTLITGTLTLNNTEYQINISGGTFTKEIGLSSGTNIVKIGVADLAYNIGSVTGIIELVTRKETIPPGAEGEGIGIVTPQGIKIEILDNPFKEATSTITINENHEEGNLANVIDEANEQAKSDSRIDIPDILKKTVYEFKFVQGENITQGTETTSEFKITIPYPVTIPDKEAKDLRICWLNPNTN